MLKGDSTIITVSFIVLAFIIIGAIALVGFIKNPLSPTLEVVPDLRAEIDAHMLAIYMSVLSNVDEGYVRKVSNESYNLIIGKNGAVKRFFSTKPLSNYYVKLEILDKDKSVLSDSSKVSFIGNLNVICDDGKECVKIKDANTFVIKKNRKGVEINAGYGEIEKDGCVQPSRAWIESKIDEYARLYNIDKEFVMSVMRQESNFRHCDRKGGYLVSSAGAIGLMQIMPSTAKYLAIDPYIPEENIEGGIRYLKEQLDRFSKYGEDAKWLAVAAYNCGPANIKYLTEYADCDKNKQGCWERVRKNLDKKCIASETRPYVDNIKCFYEKCYTRTHDINTRCELVC